MAGVSFEYHCIQLLGHMSGKKIPCSVKEVREDCWKRTVAGEGREFVKVAFGWLLCRC